VVSTTPRPLYPRERPGTHCTGGWLGPRAGLDVCEFHQQYIIFMYRPVILTKTSEIPHDCYHNIIMYVYRYILSLYVIYNTSRKVADSIPDGVTGMFH
jgi:hypothetical protein